MENILIPINRFSSKNPNLLEDFKSIAVTSGDYYILGPQAVKYFVDKYNVSFINPPKCLMGV